MNSPEQTVSFFQQKAFIYWLCISFFMLVSLFWLPLHPDEAYYWVWSKHLALSYYDGPPLTAWLLRIITDIFGIHIWSIKVIAALSVSISSLIVFKLSQKIFDTEVATKTLLIFLLIPITQATNFITSLDPLLMLLWSWSLLVLWNWLQKPSLTKTIYLGILIGLGLLAKYTMLLFLPSCLLILLFSNYRSLLASYKPYLCLIVALIISLPIWIWNYQHDWLSLTFQWHHGTEHHRLSFKDFGNYIGAQMLDINPIYFLGLIFFSIKYYKDYKQFKLIFLAIPALFVLIIFGFFGLSNLSEPNWTLPAYITLSILLGYFCDKKRISFTFISGLILNIFIILMLKFPYFMPNSINRVNPIFKIEGYQNLITQLAPNINSNLPIISNTYQNASEIEFFLNQHPNVCIVTPTRMSEITMHCTQLKQRIYKNQQSFIWMGPSKDKPSFNNINCHDLAFSQFDNGSNNKQWLLMQCSGKISKT